MDSGAAISTARAKRARLHETMCDLEKAVSVPAALPRWGADLSKHVTAVRDALIDHITEVEAADGIIARIVADSPRLAAAAQVLRDDHPALRAQGEEVSSRLAAAGPAPDPGTARLLRDSVLAFLGALSRHRYLGADLVFEAYDLDIGGQA